MHYLKENALLGNVLLAGRNNYFGSNLDPNVAFEDGKFFPFLFDNI